MNSSSSALASLLFPKPKGFRRAPTARTSLGSQFKQQLAKLMELLRLHLAHLGCT